MSLTKTNYEMLAGVFRDFLDNGDNDQLDGIGAGDALARKLADALQADNPKFDRTKFLKACGLEK